MAVTVNKADLEFILKQIEIAEAHAAGTPLFGLGGLIPTYNLSWGLRTVDGTYNNPINPTWGAADQQFPEGLGTEFRPADGTPVDFDGPGGQPPVPTALNYNPSNNPQSVVVDESLRTISNLIVDQTLANPAAIYTALVRAGVPGDAAELLAISAQVKAAYTPVAPFFDALTEAQVDEAAATAALAAAVPGSPGYAALVNAAAAATAARVTAEDNLEAERGPLDELLANNGIELEGANIVLPNVAPDEGLSAPFNSWFTLFGQFFDHGLDLVNKGGSGTVFIPLTVDDPLYDANSLTNFMVLTRATVSAGADNVWGTADDVRPVNTTTSFVDQNQTYTSHASHQVFLREYVLNTAGEPVATGKLITNSNPLNGGMATWADVKAQAAEFLGIQLVDSDVGNVPELVTDPYGNFIRGPNGFPLIMTATGPVEGDPAANGGLGLLLPANVIRTGHAFLADIAHNAVPTGLADGDIEIGLGNTDGSPTNGQYDDELLDAHFIAGDGRANENIGLTAVHHVFHAEHNRMVQQTMDVALASNDLDFLNQWLLEPVTELPADLNDLVWDGERLFQSAKFVTEMEYQHLVFEEFARKIQPQINVFLVPDGYDVTIDPSIVAEFAHVVYRFGHSMLTESIDRYGPGFDPNHIGLIEGFLNPMQFLNNGTSGVVDAEIAAGAIVRGMTRQVGNHIDEFVTSALRNNLLGLPLDLATINLARGRDTGVPALNEVRRQFYEATNEDALLKPYDSWIEFAEHLKNEASIINFIAAYGNHALITGQDTIEGKRDAALTIITGLSVGGLLVPDDAEAFLSGTGAYGAGNALGGLENVDLWIGGLAEETMPFGGMLGSTFNFVFERQMESLQNGDRFYYLQRLDGLHLFGEMENNSFAEMIMTNTDAAHLPSDVFSTPGLMLEVDASKQFNDLDGDGDLESTDPTGPGILTQVVIRNNPATPGSDDNYLQYRGGEHVVLGGTDEADILIAGIGDDTLYGDEGDDNLEGGFGNDIINGGDGDDIIRDRGGDDNIKGGGGNDVIHGGPGLDLIMGGDGQDFIVLGTDAGTEVFAGQGNDFILGSKNAERILGNEGDDWIETGTFDGAPGDNFDEIFARDGIDGHDVFLGDGGFDEFIAEGGDDIMVGSAGRGKMAGMSGWDWATYKDNPFGVDADLTRAIVFDENPNPPLNGTLDTYESIEGLSGTMFDDLLTGADTLAEERLPFLQGGTEGYAGNVLDWEAAGRIDGLRALMGSLVSETTSYSAGDIILGGDGSDVITGRGGDDVIDGDKWLNVQIGVFALSDTAHLGSGAYPAPTLYNSMKGLVNAMFAGAIKPEQLGIVRKIETGNAASGIDTAVYVGPLADYAFALVDGKLTVTDVSANPTEGTDTLSNIEQLRFGETTLMLNVGTSGDDLLGETIDIVNNLMLGFEGNDTYVVDTVSDTILEGVDGGTDTVRSFITYTLADDLENLILVGTQNINGTGNAAANVLAGNSGNNVLAGEGGVDTASYASATSGVVVSLTSAGQQVTGGAGNDTLSGFENLEGSAFDDSLTASGTAAAGVANLLMGGAGNDTLIATIDNVRDTLDGGIGIDTANYAAYAAALNVNLGAAGQIIVNGSGSNAGNSDLLVSVENFIGGSGNDTVTGSGADNTLTGGLGSDSLNGAGGNDTLVATVDNVRDTLNGGDGIDTANYSAYTAQGGLTVTLGAGQNVVGGSGSNAGNSDVLVSVENFTGGSGSDEITGSDDANILNGGGAADEINGGGGNDTINGGTGGDELNGQGGNDTINGDAGNDIIAGGAGDDIINGGAGNDTIEGGTGIDIIDGGADNDTIEGGAGNDLINGGAGADLLIGGNGADTINAGVADDNLQDIFRFSAASEFGDTVTNFDVSGNGNQRDMVQFSGDFNPGGGNGAAGWDDGNNNNDFLFASGNGVDGTGAVSVTVGQGNGDAEALILGIAEGVANLQSTADVAAAFNTEFAISAALGEDALLVINNTSGTGFSLWQWVQMTGGTAEVDTGELSLIGTFASNGAVAANNFDFV